MSRGAGIATKRWARQDADYEGVRRASVWQLATPDRFPELIIEAVTIGDVVAAVTDPDLEHLAVSVKGSGHNFTGTQLRDDSVLIDVSALDSISVDGDGAHVGAGVRNGDLSAALLAAGRMFQTGHHAEVGIGGYLLPPGCVSNDD